MASSRTGPGRPRNPAADAKILLAAMEQLIEQGIERASMENIARRAGVAKMTVYRRWSTKEELLAEAIEAARAEIPDATSTGRPASELPLTIAELLPYWGEVLADSRFRLLSARLIGAGPSHPALLAAYWEHHVLPRRQRARETMLSAQAHGVLDPDADIDVLLDMLAGAVIHNLLMNPEPRSAAEISDYLGRLLRQVGFTIAAPA
ncbi:TetR family transcriptional regulator [Tamaricihabitans halophyticus]|uniref:TetR family transcriptional regulator n=1 Tax=Tamaricihabitans halophyticus TaxID=1262583 RepID=A0A4R2R6K5_9PSEU|nr:TetR/AcrR family transcriptional regulator [Tamaricihabitans halophyticus]TCP57499.1 TetR family transcriptional regulator [Tamaricihabitans halophyticus]